MSKNLFNFHDRNNKYDVFDLSDPCGLNKEPFKKLSADVQSLVVKPGVVGVCVGSFKKEHHTHLSQPAKTVSMRTEMIDCDEKEPSKRVRVEGSSMALDIDTDYNKLGEEEIETFLKRRETPVVKSGRVARVGVKTLNFKRNGTERLLGSERRRVLV